MAFVSGVCVSGVTGLRSESCAVGKSSFFNRAGYGSQRMKSAVGPTMSVAIGRKGGVETYAAELAATAKAIASPGKGLLAVDESTNTIGKRLASIGLKNTESARQTYRELLFTCHGLGDFISGAILFEETLYQSTSNGKPFVECLKEIGVVPGIKVDKGLSPLGGAESFETFVNGIDGLSDRAAAYYKQGARFAKWRAVLQISKNTPSKMSLAENCWGLARYAKSCQDAGLVPIVEPEILMDGDHPIERTAEVQEEVLATVYRYCEMNGVYLEGSLLKPNMVVPGTSYAGTTSPEEIAAYTVRTLQRTVPSAVPGIMFLSGGMSEEEASVNLSAMNSIERVGPWSLSFSYGRALQQSCLKTWLGKSENTEAAQEALRARGRANSLATLGKYMAGSEKSLDALGSFEKGYKH